MESIVTLKRAIALTIEHGSGSTAMLQRRMAIGYNSAYRLLCEMEKIGVVEGSFDAKPSKLLIDNINQVDFKKSSYS